MSLIKTIAYALLGYVLYELFLGIAEGETARKNQPAGNKANAGNFGGPRRNSGPQFRAAPRNERNLSESGGRPGNAAAPRSQETTRHASGASSRHDVGRGIID
jgi:hypothetical protein